MSSAFCILYVLVVLFLFSVSCVRFWFMCCLCLLVVGMCLNVCSCLLVVVFVCVRVFAGWCVCLYVCCLFVCLLG